MALGLPLLRLTAGAQGKPPGHTPWPGPAAAGRGSLTQARTATRRYAMLFLGWLISENPPVAVASALPWD